MHRTCPHFTHLFSPHTAHDRSSSVSRSFLSFIPSSPLLKHQLWRPRTAATETISTDFSHSPLQLPVPNTYYNRFKMNPSSKNDSDLPIATPAEPMSDSLRDSGTHQLQSTASTAEHPNMAEHIIGLMCDPYYTNKSTCDVPPSIQTDKMSKRLSSVLDSLAVVLVSQETKEVISVGVRLSPTNEIVLSIADNKPVGLNIETHARDL